MSGSCVGCGKTGAISAHRFNCPIPLMWEAHNKGDHRRCEDGGRWCKIAESKTVDELIALIRVYGMTCSSGEGYLDDEAEALYMRIAGFVRALEGGIH